MNLKLPGRGSRPLRTAIKEHSPWKLKQVWQQFLGEPSNCREQVIVCMMEVMLLRGVNLHFVTQSSNCNFVVSSTIGNTVSSLFFTGACTCTPPMQVQDSANYFSQAQNKLKEIKASKPIGPTHIKAAFEELAKCLRSAEEVLVLPPPISAHHIYTSEQKVRLAIHSPLLIFHPGPHQNQLKPDIPEDVAIHFHISAAMLVLTILSVIPLSRGQHSSSAKHSHLPSSSSWLGSTL